MMQMQQRRSFHFLLILLLSIQSPCSGLTQCTTRRQAFVTAGAAALGIPLVAHAEEESSIPDRFDVDNFLKTGMVQNPMGVSGQAGT